MKKFVTILLVALLAVSALFVLVACDDKPVAEDKAVYILSGGNPGWDDKQNLYSVSRVMTPISQNDERVKSIKKELKDAQYIYIGVITISDDGDWGANNPTYALTEGADPTVFMGGHTVKCIRVHEVTADGITEWVNQWIPDPQGVSVPKNLTPDTMYIPPYSQDPAYTNSGTWADNPVILENGTYYFVVANMDGTNFGLAAIKID